MYNYFDSGKKELGRCVMRHREYFSLQVVLMSTGKRSSYDYSNILEKNTCKEALYVV